jgi:hypothetical protein
LTCESALTKVAVIITITVKPETLFHCWCNLTWLKTRKAHLSTSGAKQCYNMQPARRRQGKRCLHFRNQRANQASTPGLQTTLPDYRRQYTSQPTEPHISELWPLHVAKNVYIQMFTNTAVLCWLQNPFKSTAKN